MSLTTSPEYLNQSQIQILAEDPKNQVYTYVHDEPTAKFTAKEQLDLSSVIRIEYLKLRKEFAQYTDIQLREQILNSQPKLKLFADNNTRIVDTLTNRNSSEDHVNHIRYMIYLRCQVESGFITDIEAQQMIQDYLVRVFDTGLSPAEYEQQIGKSPTSKK